MLLALLTVLLGLLVAPVSPAQAQSLRSRLSTDRMLARLESSTSSRERAALLEVLGRVGPQEHLAPVFLRLLATEIEPVPRQALLAAIARVAISRSGPEIFALEEALLERYRAAPSGERAPFARALSALAAAGSPSTAGLEALLERLPDEASARWLREAPTLPVVLTALRGAEGDPLLVLVRFLGELGDVGATEPLLARLGRGGAELDAEIARALGRLGDGRASAPLIELCRTSSDAALLRAVLDALASLGASEASDAVFMHLSDADSAVAAAALHALGVLDPARAAPLLLAALEETPERRAVVRRVLSESRASALVPLARALHLSSGDVSGAGVSGDGLPSDLAAVALDFLARAEGGAGIATLRELDAPPLALALALRRTRATGAEASAPGPLPSVALSSPVLSSLAGDGVSLEALSRGDVLARRSAAMALAITLSAPSASALSRALSAETDEAVRSWLIEAARRHGLALDAAEVRELVERADAERPHEAASLLSVIPAALAAPSTAGVDRRWLARRLSRGLLSALPAERAAASLALARAGRVASAAAIEALLEDPEPWVRIAAAHAVRSLAPERAPFLLARAFIETDERAARIISALGRHEAATGARDILVLETVAHPSVSGTVWLDVRTDDGLWRVLPAAPSGELILVDVPGEVADVSVVLR